ncbi:MAG: T9SS type A sorting domain-containing protein [Bacteroidota bacterium]
MKKLLLSGLALTFTFSVFAQNNRESVQSRLNESTQNQKRLVQRPSDAAIVPTRAINPTVSSNRGSMVETVIGQTTYDLQSNYGSVGNRVHRSADGSISVVWTKGDTPTAYPDRGMGYNYWNGSSWGPIPTARQEAYRTGWPNIGVTGTGGEAVVNHGTNPTNLHTRPTKGSGAWTSGALGTTTVTWPRMDVGGANGNSIHVIGNPNAAPFYNFYSRSTDGGATWSDENVVLPNWSTYFFEGSVDGYDIDSRGDIVAMVFGGFSESLVMYKSTDNGATWTTTVINEFPLAPYDPNLGISDVDGDGVADTIPTTDSGISCVIDNNGTVHVVTGSTRILCEVSPDVSYFPGTDGLLYWNETMPAGDITNNVIAFVEDIDGSGVIEIAPNIAIYQCGLTSMPSLGIDADNNIHLVYSSIIENTTNGNPDPAWEESFRNSFYMTSSDMGMNWSTPVRLNGSDFDEMVWPMLPKSIGNTVDVFYYKDGEPGNTFQPTGNPDAPAPYDVIHTPQPNPFSSVAEVATATQVSVFPNPASYNVQVTFNMANAQEVSLQLVDVLGKTAYSSQINAVAGSNNQSISVRDLASGIYTLNIVSANGVATQKVVVK